MSAVYKRSVTSRFGNGHDFRTKPCSAGLHSCGKRQTSLWSRSERHCQEILTKSAHGPDRLSFRGRHASGIVKVRTSGMDHYQEKFPQNR